MKFQDKLKKFLQEQKISSNALAKNTGIPQTTISNWLNRGSKPNIEDIEKICNYFNCSVDYLLGRESEEEQGVLNRFRKLDKKGKEIAITIMTMLQE